jgi:hypothetical protein
MSCKSTVILWAIHTAGVLGGRVVAARVELNVASASPKLTTFAYPGFMEHLGFPATQPATGGNAVSPLMLE